MYGKLRKGNIEKLGAMEVFIVTTCTHLVRSVWNAQRLICHRFFPYQCTCSSNPLKPRDLSVLGCFELIWSEMRQQQSASWLWISWCIALVHFCRCKLQGFKTYDVHITVQVWIQVANDQLMRKMWMHWIGISLSCDHWNIPQKKLYISKFTLILRILLFFPFFYWLRYLFQVKGLCGSMGWEAVISKACLGLWWLCDSK